MILSSKILSRLQNFNFHQKSCYLYIRLKDFWNRHLFFHLAVMTGINPSKNFDIHFNTDTWKLQESP